MKRLIVPVDLGGSPTRCAVSPPLDDRPGPDLVAALVEHYTSERAPEGEHQVEVAFFRGGLPGDDLLDAAAPHPVRVACSPADLSSTDARRLRGRGVETVEIEALCFDTPTLRALRRGYTGGFVDSMLDGLRQMGFRTGIVLAPGLPGTTHEDAVDDARRIAGDQSATVDFARITPALAFEGSDLAGWARDGRWTPMDLGHAVTTCLAMVDVLEDAGVDVIRLGLQPGQDVPHTLVAGPYHPNLRALVQVRRFLGLMEQALSPMPRGHRAILLVHPKDLSWAKGTANDNIRTLRARLKLRDLVLEVDETVERGTIRVA